MRYFDHNATSPLCPAARAAWLQASERFPGNPSSPHRLGARAAKALDDARAAVAERLGAKAEEIVWTSGATESNNTVLHHFARSGAGEVWISAVEHPCVHAAAERWLPGRVRVIPVNAGGVVEIAALDALRAEAGVPGLVMVMAANNEIGVLQPWRAIAEWCAAAGVAYACDAAQWLGKLPATGLGVATYVVGCAHKFGGPAGVGFLRAARPLAPLLVGGPQEDGQRAGTENVAGVLAAVAALESREAAMREEAAEIRATWRTAFEAEIVRELPGTIVVGEASPRLWNTSALLLPPSDCRRRWVVVLDRLGFAVSTGSACASGREKPSHVLAALGLDGSGERLMRVSAGWETTREEWGEVGGALRQAAREVMKGASGEVVKW